MDPMKPLLGLENCRIKFLTGEGDYEGTISRIAPEIQLLVVNKIIWLPKNLKMGTLTFRAKEIKSFEVISRPEIVPSVDSPECNYQDFYQGDDQRPTILDDEFDDQFSVEESELYSELDYEETEFKFDLPPALNNVLPLDNVVIDTIDENFHCAMDHLKRQDVIGFTLESPKIGRYEDLHWLCISTVSCTFLFDIMTLGELAFTNGIKEILEDPLIEKVVHDCRKISDCLFHCYNTKLANVFDTQVADFIINQQRRKCEIKPYVHPLNSCLSNYLDIPEEFLFRPKKRSHQDDVVFYGLRPIREDLRNLFTKNVIYLRRLKQELDLLLMEPMDKCVDVYMKSLRSKTDRELKLETFVPNVVPDELLFERIQIFRFKDHVDIPAAVCSGPPYRQFLDSFKDFASYIKKNGLEDS